MKDESAGSVIQVTLGAGSPYVVLVPNRLGKAPLPIRKAGLTTPTAAVTIAARTADSNICARVSGLNRGRPACALVISRVVLCNCTPHR